MKRSEVQAFIKALITMRNDAPDDLASKVVSIYPTMKYNGKRIPAKTRINWNGNLKLAAVDLWDTEENNPDNAQTLWEDIDYKDGFRIIPAVITATGAFAKGECGWWKGELYESLLDANVYTPEQYPTGWKVNNYDKGAD